MARMVGVRGLGGAGLAGVVLGLLVLSSSGAQGVGVDPFDPVDEDWLDTLRSWNHIREVGAALLVLGLAALSVVAGGLVAAGRGPARRVVIRVGVVAGLLLVVGLVAFGWLREAEVEYVGIHKLGAGPGVRRPVALATMVWTRGQAAAALVATAGLLLGCGVAGMSRARVIAGRRRDVNSV